MTPALFQAAGGGFVADPIARGPWDEGMMHGGAPSALIAREIERMAPGSEEMVVARLTVDFLGAVPIGHVATRGPARTCRSSKGCPRDRAR